MSAGAAATVVHRAVGFMPAFEWVAETTVELADGLATTRAGGHTEWGAETRALLEASHRLTSRKRACGFTADGYRVETTRADFRIGFA